MTTNHINTEKVIPLDVLDTSNTLIHTNYEFRWQNTEIYQKWQN